MVRLLELLLAGVGRHEILATAPTLCALLCAQMGSGKT